MARGLYVVRGMVRRLMGPHPGQGLPGEGKPTDPGWGIEEGERPEVEPPDIDGMPEFPWIPGDGDDGVPPGTIWPPFEVVPPMQPVPEHVWVVVGARGLGYRYVKIHVPSVRDQLQAIKDRLPAGGVGGRPPQRPGGTP